MLAAMVGTGSHGAWLGLALGLLAAADVRLPRNDPRPQAVQAQPGGTQISIVPAACWPMALLTLTLTQRIMAQLYGRVYLWTFSWPIFWRHPIVGSGWGTYQLLYLDLQGKFLAAHPEYVGYWTNNRLLHNDPLQLLLEAGLLGFAAFVWVLWKYGGEVLGARRRAASAWPRYAIAASVGGVTAILVDSLFNYQFAVPPTYILLFTLLAIPGLLREAEVAKENGDLSLATPPARHPWHGPHCGW